MAKLPQRDKIKMLLEDTVIVEKPRPYLGMSQLGVACKRQLWYSFRACYDREITPRQKRIFNRGDLEEPRVLEELKNIGIHIIETQTNLVGFAGHCRGHTDGLICNVPGFPKDEMILLEIKTAKNSSFKKYPKEKLKGANKQYYAQVQVYMHHLGLRHCLFIVTNKDTEERYYEIVHYNKTEAIEYDEVAEQVIATDQPPAKIAGPEWFECKWCDAYQICHFGESISPTCRNCNHAEIRDEGVWHCLKFEEELSVPQQIKSRVNDKCYDKLTELSSGSD